MTREYRPIPFRPERVPLEETLRRAEEFYARMNRRRSLRFFAADPVPREAIEWAIRTASTAPSGAHRQPWRFIAVSDRSIRREIRIAAEREEREFYTRRIPEEWRRALRPIGTGFEKPYLETAPWLVVLMAETHGVRADGTRRKNYYVNESVGIAAGMFIAAIHVMGLFTLTHTPSPMRFLSRILGRPENERPYILFPVGYPAPDATVPDLRRKTIDEVAVFLEDGPGETRPDRTG